jgi:hypothetical protein
MTTPPLLGRDGLDPDEPLPSGSVRSAGRIGVGEPSTVSVAAVVDFCGVVGFELRVKTSRPLVIMETNLDPPPSLGVEGWAALAAIEFVDEEEGSCLFEEVAVVGDDGD